MTTATFQASDVVTEIVRQVKALGIPVHRYTIMQLDPMAVRFHKPGRVARNIDIRYNAGSDLYDCQKHTIRMHGLDVTTEDVDGLYADSLASLFA